MSKALNTDRVSHEKRKAFRLHQLKSINRSVSNDKITILETLRRNSSVSAKSVKSKTIKTDDKNLNDASAKETINEEENESYSNDYSEYKAAQERIVVGHPV